MSQAFIAPQVVETFAFSFKASDQKENNNSSASFRKKLNQYFSKALKFDYKWSEIHDEVYTVQCIQTRGGNISCWCFFLLKVNLVAVNHNVFFFASCHENITLGPWMHLINLKLKTKTPYDLKALTSPLVILKDQYSHLVYPNICIEKQICEIYDSFHHRSWQTILTEKHPCCLNVCAFRMPKRASGLYAFLKNYVTSEGAVSHNVLYYNSSPLLVYANNYFE